MKNTMIREMRQAGSAVLLLGFLFPLSVPAWAGEASDSFKPIQKHFIKAQRALEEEKFEKSREELQKAREILEETRKDAKGRARHLLKNTSRSLERLEKDITGKGGKKRKKSSRIQGASFDANAALSAYLCKTQKDLTCFPKQCSTEEGAYQVIFSDKDKTLCPQKNLSFTPDP